MNKQTLIQYVDKKFARKEPAPFRIGDTVRVHGKIIEGDSTRIQVFEGVVMAIKGQGGARNFIVRKISFGVGVERSFPLNSPAIQKIDVIRSGHVRRAKLYYLRSRVGRSAKLEEKSGAIGINKKSVPQEVKTPVASPEELVTAEEK